MKHFFCLGMLLAFLPAIACINYMGVTVFGKSTINDMSEHGGHFLHQHQHTEKDRAALLKDIENLKQIIAGNPSHYAAHNDLAVDYLRLGSYELSLQLLLKNYSQRPTDYNVNANLGVVYELLGNMDSALHFTSKAWQINPESHMGSEWLHIKILQLSKTENPEQALLDDRLLGLNFGNGDIPDTTLFPLRPYFNGRQGTGRPRDSISMLISHIEYQLHERTYFVKPKNKIVGELFFVLGDLYSLFYDRYWALWAYTRALEYGTMHDEVIRKRGKRLLPAVKAGGRPGTGQHSKLVQDYKKVIAFWNQAGKAK